MPSFTPETNADSMPYAPLVERCFDIEVGIEAQEFEDKAASYLAQVGEDLDLTTHKNIEHWLVRIEKAKSGPPRPKASFFSIPQVCKATPSLRLGTNVESFHFLPPTAQGKAKLRYSQCRPKSLEPITPYLSSRFNLMKVLQRFDEHFGTGRLGRVSICYWNDLMLMKDEYFNEPGIFSLNKALRFFQHNGLNVGTLTPPWQTRLNWALPGMEGSQTCLEIGSDADGPVWTIISYLGKERDANTLTMECIAEIDFAHEALYNIFSLHFTPQALEYFRNGKVSPQ